MDLQNYALLMESKGGEQSEARYQRAGCPVCEDGDAMVYYIDSEFKIKSVADINGCVKDILGHETGTRTECKSKR